MDRDLHLSVRLPLGSFHLSADGFGLGPVRRWADSRDGLVFGCSFDCGDCVLRIDCGTCEVSWRRDSPWYRKGIRVDFLDLLLGRIRSTDRHVPIRGYLVDVRTGKADVMVPMPEGSYRASVEIVEVTCRRPRWPFPRRYMRARVDIPAGIPHAGKGENSWDCGDDATYGISCPASYVEEAVAKLVESVLCSRKEYGAASDQGALVLAPRQVVHDTKAAAKNVEGP
jgi:hypothetical protein